MNPFPKGTAVRQIVTPIQGEVVDVKYDADVDTFQYLVQYTGADNEVTTRWFTYDELEGL